MNSTHAVTGAHAPLKGRTLHFLLVLLISSSLPVVGVGFSDINAGLPGLARGMGAWGDYDNDGDLDLILVGFENLVGDRLGLWRNHQGIFTRTQTGLPETAYGAPVWADYDNDGDLDLALLVAEPVSYNYTTEIWRNEAGLFTREYSLPIGSFDGTMAWADVDADGDLDLFFNGPDLFPCPLQVLRNDRGSFVPKATGIDAEVFAVADYDKDGDADVVAQSGSVTRLWRNDRGTFVDANVALAGISAESFVWADYDQDGDPDLLISGPNNTGPATQSLTRLFRNDGGPFTELPTALPPLVDGGLAWGDFDNDGDLDLAGLTINSGSVNAYSGILRNTSGVLADSSTQFPFQFTSTVAWGDYDNDGDLDLLLSGGHQNGKLVTQIFRNNNPLLNSPPSAPGGLSAAISGASVTLRWSSAADAQTSSAGLTYNLRIGTRPGGIDVMSPQADLASGRRRLAQFGNASQGTTASLVLPVGTFYWSVQAVDSAFAGGPFSAESTFSVTAPEPGAKTREASGVTSTEATLNGEIDPRGLPTSIRFEWGKTIDYGQSTAWQSLSGTGWRPASQTLTGLEIGVLYHYRIVASSSAGTVFGSDQCFTTKRFIPGATMAPGVLVTSHAWGDYDNDGDLDVVVGTFDLVTSSSATELWRNNNGGFAKINSGLPPIIDTMAWGDYDRDGDLDLVLSGSAGDSGFFTQIWDNDKGRFSDIAAGLPGSDGWSAAWGDLDNDGDLDLVITGDALRSQSIQIWLNNGGSFAQAKTSFPAVFSPQTFLGDFDNDGDLDVLITGGTDWGSVTRLYRNNRGAFTESNQQFRGFQTGDASWGDFDSDGDLDLAIGGLFERDDGLSDTTTEIWRNDDGVFAVAATNLGYLQNPRLAWGDCDNDGDLDLILSGIAADGAGTSKLFRNDQGSFTELDTGLTNSGPVSWADYDADGDLDLLIGGQLWRNAGQPFNTTPSAPANLSASAAEGRLIFSWTPAADAQTPSAALSYNLRVGTQPGQDNLVAAQADISTGFRRLPQSGMVQGARAFLSAVKLPLGDYYWSAQAIDGVFAGGKFAPESNFKFGSGAPLVESGTASPGASTAGVQGSVHPRGLLTAVWLEWGKTTSYGQSLRLPDLSGATGLDVTATLTGLEVETVYHFRLKASNAVGLTYGLDQTFRTRRFTPVRFTPSSVEVTAADWGDFDGDGDLDLVICGSDSHGPITQIWRKDYWVFVPVAAQLPGIQSGIVAWGDFDHDGDLDLLICGESLTQVWRNDAAIFRLAASLPGVSRASAAWGDYDNDGDLDLLLAGSDDTANITAIWRNDLGYFLSSGTQLPQLARPHATWLDYDKDGDLDLLEIGANVSAPFPWQTSATELWRNENGTFIKATLDRPPFGIDSATWADYDGDGDLDVLLCFDSAPTQIRRNQADSLTETGARLPPLLNSSTSWGDYDGDGDLDLAVAGESRFGPVQQIWRNDQGTFVDIDAGLTHGACVAWADFDQDGDLDLLVGGQIWRNDAVSINAPPSAPLALNQTVTAGNRVLFNWSPAADDQTQPAGLIYNFRLVGNPANLSSPFSIITVARGTSTFLNLPDDIYYWSVQAVDSAAVRGPWAPERRLVLSADRDADGMPDLWETNHGLDPSSNADAVADADGDGAINVEEFAANTDPSNPNQMLAIIAIEPDGLDLLLLFASARGTSYRLEESLTSPNGPWTRVLENVPSDGEETALRITGGLEQPTAFYRVIAQP